jgi:hypothetical protein
VKAIACGAWNAEAKSGAGAVLGAGAKWRERISAGAKLRRAVSGATEYVAISFGVAADGSGIVAESDEGIPASARVEWADRECSDVAAASAAVGATLGPGPMIRTGAAVAAGLSAAPANRNEGAVGKAIGIGRGAGVADAIAMGVSERGENAAGESAAGRSRGVSDEVPVGVGAVSVSARAIGAAGGGVTVAASARAISAESGLGSVGCAGASGRASRDDGRARAGVAGFEVTDFGADMVFSPRGETGGVTSTETTVAAVVDTTVPGTTTGARGAEVRAGCAVS